MDATEALEALFRAMGVDPVDVTALRYSARPEPQLDVFTRSGRTSAEVDLIKATGPDNKPLKHKDDD